MQSLAATMTVSREMDGFVLEGGDGLEFFGVGNGVPTFLEVRCVTISHHLENHNDVVAIYN